MNIPFDLTISSTTPRGVLWNPWGATVPDSVLNAIYDTGGLTAELQRRYSLIPPVAPVWVVGFSIVGDTDDAVVALGTYNVADDRDDVLYSTVATCSAGGGIVERLLGSGFLLPLSADCIPVLLFTPGSGSVRVTGTLSLSVMLAALDPGAPGITPPSPILLDEQSADQILDEQDGNPIYQE